MAVPSRGLIPSVRRPTARKGGKVLTCRPTPTIGACVARERISRAQVRGDQPPARQNRVSMRDLFHLFAIDVNLRISYSPRVCESHRNPEHERDTDDRASQIQLQCLRAARSCHTGPRSHIRRPPLRRSPPQTRGRSARTHPRRCRWESAWPAPGNNTDPPEKFTPFHDGDDDSQESRSDDQTKHAIPSFAAFPPLQFRNFRLALEVKDATALEFHAVANQPTNYLSAAADA